MNRYDLKNLWFSEFYDTDTLELLEEMVPYELIHALLEDICRLEKLVFDTRTKVNALSKNGVIYDCVSEDVCNGIYFDHPAMSRYIELYGDTAIIHGKYDFK